MKKKIVGLITMMLLITPVLIVTADENNNLIVNHPPDAPVIVSGPASQGVAKGIIFVEDAQIEGIPTGLYIGSLTEVDLQLNSVNIFIVVPLPLFFFVTFFENTENIHLKMDSFWGMTDSTDEENAMIVGFGRNIEWEW